MQKLQQTLKQQQKLSPLQIQQAKLLELTALEIENRINQELEDNPALEEEPESILDLESEGEAPEDFDLGDYRTEDDIPDYKLRQNNYSPDDQKNDIPYSEDESFQEFLIGQLRLKELSPIEYQVGEYLIGNLDGDGYLRREPEDISNDLAFQYNLDISAEEIKNILKVVQELDPIGVGATDLRNCLILQLERKEPNKERNIALNILKDFFEYFSKKQYDKIMKAMGISENDLKEAIPEITSLNPRPGASWERAFESKMAQIIPDFYVETINGEIFFSMPERHIPQLKVSPEYNEILESYSKGKEIRNKNEKDALIYAKQKVDSAKWFIDAIKQRNITLEKTMLAIIDIQKEFFLNGEDSYLRPMILKDVAERTGYDISTISRVSNSKYVQTNWGVLPLKYFFSEGMTNEDGEEVSTKEIKAILKEIIEGENKTKPYTDEVLGKELKKRGYDIARRTVAKYREQLDIPIARLRKRI